MLWRVMSRLESHVTLVYTVRLGDDGETVQKVAVKTNLVHLKSTEQR